MLKASSILKSKINKNKEYFPTINKYLFCVKPVTKHIYPESNIIITMLLHAKSLSLWSKITITKEDNMYQCNVELPFFRSLMRMSIYHNNENYLDIWSKQKLLMSTVFEFDRITSGCSMTIHLMSTSPITF